MTENVISRLSEYQLDNYIEDVEAMGLEATWDFICQYVLGNPDRNSAFLSIDNFGELYEIGLAAQDKIGKKKSGQYYTPDDVALIMSSWLEKCEGEAVCDVACGTGKLILTYLDEIGYDKARSLISSGNLYLYDFDKVALKICRTAIAVKYGLDIADRIHDICGDFLEQSVVLPSNCKVISNPPYAHIASIRDSWEHTDVLRDTSELYSAFMEKIFRQATSTVIITPFSFISGTNFYSLRKEMCELGNGFVVAFDNVPGNIFCGRKHGIFNTNTANSVRAAITVFKQDAHKKGVRVTPLVRFKNEQRKEVLNCSVLENLLTEEYQIVDCTNDSFKKIEKKLWNIYADWTGKSRFLLEDFLSESETPYFIDMPNTCRYYTTASSRKLNRTGSIVMNLKDEASYDFIYCLINSSFTYWWWRIFDGGITYPIGLLNRMPVPMNLLTDEDLNFFRETRQKLSSEERNFIIVKKNAGAMHENIKFPEGYRESINEKILEILGHKPDGKLFEGVHANYFQKE